MNTSDGVLNGIRDTAQRASVIRPWTAIPTSGIGEVAVNFDIVLNFTPTETTAPLRPTLVAVSGGVVSAATNRAGASTGSFVTLFGDSLAATTRTWGAADIVNGKLPESLDGVSVSIGGKPASVYYISPKQINVIAPGDASLGTVPVTVSNTNGASDPVTADVQEFAPGFFLLAQEHVSVVRSDGAYLGPSGLVDGLTTVPAKPGDSVLLFGTGFGPVNPAAPPGRALDSALPLANQVKIGIDTTIATVAGSGLLWVII